jgi:lysozyme
MNQLNDPKLEASLISSEGKEPFAYQDSLGYWTIGIGCCIDKRKGEPLTLDEMLYLMRNRMQRRRDALSNYDWFKKLDQTRQGVLVEMAFNLGVGGVLNFKKMIAAIQNQDWDNAVEEMKDSLWATQIQKSRMDSLCYRMLNGSYN